jgi:aryl-alcohol dehydrogenase-like predicted oxidoreductase
MHTWNSKLCNEFPATIKGFEKCLETSGVIINGKVVSSAIVNKPIDEKFEGADYSGELLFTSHGLTSQTVKAKYGDEKFKYVDGCDHYEAAHPTIGSLLTYGDAEKVVGELNQNRFEIISKLPDLSKIESSEDYNEVSVFLQQTLENTQQQQLCAYLLHSIDNLKINGDVLWKKMQDLKEHGLTKKIGYSLYSPKQLDLYFDQYKPDIVQIPMNVLDREFQKTGWLKKLKDNGVEIHVRSVFLQGLLLMEYENQLLKFPTHKSIWDLLRNELNSFGSSALDYCLGFAKAVEEIDEIVVGANSSYELRETMSSKSKLSSVPIELASSDEQLIYPFKWH